MKTAILLIVMLTACCSKRVATDTAWQRSDTVAALRSRSASTFDRVLVWETVAMRPDTITGRMRVVSRDIVRRTERSESVQGDTAIAAARSESVQHDEQKDVTVAAAPAGNGEKAFAIGGVWLLFTALAFCLAAYLAKKWTSRH